MTDVIGIPGNTVHYLKSMIPLANWFNRPDFEWYQNWTIFYWAWWISWSPFVGMFIARVSKGRTVRQFLAAVLVMPVGVSVIWFTVFGTTAITQAQAGLGKIAEPMTDASLVLFHMLANLPMVEIVSSFAIILLLIFFVTSSDSGSLVIDTITAGGKLRPDRALTSAAWRRLAGCNPDPDRRRPSGGYAKGLRDLKPWRLADAQRVEETFCLEAGLKMMMRAAGVGVLFAVLCTLPIASASLPSLPLSIKTARP